MRGIISCSSLGQRGRFGNSLFSYIGLKAIATQFNYELQVPADWLGRTIFQIDDPPISKERTPVDLDTFLIHGQLDYWLPRLDGANCQGYLQHQRFLDLYSRPLARQWLTLRPEFQDLEAQIRAAGGSQCSALHKRRGDYLNPFFITRYCQISDASYERALDQFHIPLPLFRVEEGWRQPNPELARRGLDFIEDFLILKNASHLLRSNSTFSWWSAALGDGKVYSPVVGDKVGWQEIQFIEGNHPKTAPAPNQSDLYLKP